MYFTYIAARVVARASRISSSISSYLDKSKLHKAVLELAGQSVQLLARSGLMMAYGWLRRFSSAERGCSWACLVLEAGQ
jgi:hypothetical protein